MHLAGDANGTVVLLGAGASADAGLPLTYQATEEIVTRVNQPGSRSLAAVLNFVCGSLMQYDAARGGNPYDGLDVERVFSAVEMLAERDDLEISPFVLSWHPAVDHSTEARLSPSFGSQFRKAVEDEHDAWGTRLEQVFTMGVQELTRSVDSNVHRRLMEVMTSELSKLIRVTDESLVDYLVPLMQWIAGGDGSRCIVTLNYDRTIEMAGERAGVAVDTGIESLSTTGRWSVDEGAVALLKLHGSIDWELTKTRDISLPLTVDTLSFRNDWSTKTFLPAIVFGRRGKLRVEGPFLELLRAFEGQLHMAQRLIAVGYSFRDHHVNEYIRRWLTSSTRNQLVIVDPNFPDRPERGSFQGDLSYVTRQKDQSDRVVVVREGAADALSALG